MNIREPRLRAAFAAALAVALPACKKGPEGIEPPDLTEVCTAPSLLEHVTPAEPVDFLAIRRVEGYPDEPTAPHVEVDAWGTACAGASDVATCEATLAETWPTGTGWGYCGEGCSDSGLVWTRGDTVGLADAPDEVAALLADIDSVADVLLVATANGYAPSCESVRLADDGAWQLSAVFMTSDCPWTEETRLVRIASDGALTVLATISTDASDVCAGRRPDGLHEAPVPLGDAVARHLATMAHLEAAAVVAFERLAADLAAHGAPASLVQRALDAAADEVRHASVLTGLAESHGAVVPAVVVEPARSRTLREIAHENAVEGCVRETFGAVDAGLRAEQAPTAALRAVFAGIARDEARHAELSWDIARWAESVLDAATVRELVAARDAAWAELLGQVARSPRDAVQAALGAPSRSQALAMVGALRERLAA